MDEDHVIYVKRTLDQNMLELNRQGYLNGHTPFSALVAFSGIMAPEWPDFPMWHCQMNPVQMRAP